jgi:hypothetical protein
VFISEHYHEFRRKVRDFALTLALFSIVQWHDLKVRISGSRIEGFERQAPILVVPTPKAELAG